MAMHEGYFVNVFDKHGNDLGMRGYDKDVICLYVTQEEAEKAIRNIEKSGYSAKLKAVAIFDADFE